MHSIFIIYKHSEYWKHSKAPPTLWILNTQDNDWQLKHILWTLLYLSLLLIIDDQWLYYQNESKMFNNYSVYNKIFQLFVICTFTNLHTFTIFNIHYVDYGCRRLMSWALSNNSMIVRPNNSDFLLTTKITAFNSTTCISIMKHINSTCTHCKNK